MHNLGVNEDVFINEISLTQWAIQGYVPHHIDNVVVDELGEYVQFLT